MNRRTFLRRLGAGAALALMPLPGLSQQAASLPVLMFHKVTDRPEYPEDVSTEQLAALFAMLWKEGFFPVNLGDILDGTVDRVVPRGLKPVGITADDAHRSILYSCSDWQHDQQRNARSFMALLRDSLKPLGWEPRATLFLSEVNDTRCSMRPEGYFGNYEPLPKALERLADLPGVELGYHTRSHVRMKGMRAREVRELLEEQINDFARQGVRNRMVPLFAYPYGVLPAEDGVDELRKLGFRGAVLAFPGSREARYETVPAAGYDGHLLCDPFLIPRVCIGSHSYTYRNTVKGNEYTPIDPLEDFRKDVTQALPALYVSRGKVD